MSPKTKVSGLNSSPLGRTQKKLTCLTRPTLDLRLQTLDFSPRTLVRPFVLMNMAMTADGKIATANRAVSSFGSRRDHEHLLELRATADAVMSGARTVDSAKISMGTGGMKFQRQRLKLGLAEHNLRIIVSGSGSIDSCAEIFKHKFSPIIVLTTRRMTSYSRRGLKDLGATIKICGEREINFRSALRWLYKRWGVKRLLCEGGGDLNDAMFRAGLVDELHLTVCPKVFGGRIAPSISEGCGFGKIALSSRLKLKSTKRIGDEIFLVFSKML